MRVLLFTYLFPSDELPQRGLFNLSRARALLALGHDVRVVAPVCVYPHDISLRPPFRIAHNVALVNRLRCIPEYEEYEGFKVHRPKWFKLPDSLLWDFKSTELKAFAGKSIDSYIRVFDPDLILASWMNPYGVYARFLRKHHRAKYFVIFEGSDILIEPQGKRNWSRLRRCLNQYCDVTIAVSENMYDRLAREERLTNLVLVPNGFENERFPFSWKKASMKENRFRVVSVANFNHAKGQDILIRAMRLLGNSFHLTLVGDGPLMPACRALAEREGVAGRINFAGAIPHSQIASILSDNDLFCLPSRSEGLPAAPLEGMSVGLPVVSTRVGGMTRVIREGLNGLLCDSIDPRTLARTIEVASRLNWDRLSISKTAREEYGWSKWAVELMTLCGSSSGNNEKFRVPDTARRVPETNDRNANDNSKVW